MTLRANNSNAANDETALNHPLFNIHSIYLKDLSYEAPHVPTIFNEEWKPKIDFDLQMGSEILSDKEGVFEVVLHITVTATIGEDEQKKPSFLIDLKQAGAFTIKNIPDEGLKEILATTCPTILFPYARETITSLATRGGFPQLVLPPIDFDGMYAHHLANEQTTANTHPTTV